MYIFLAMTVLLLLTINIEKWKKNEFCMSSDYWSKIDFIASKFILEVDFG